MGFLSQNIYSFIFVQKSVIFKANGASEMNFAFKRIQKKK